MNRFYRLALVVAALGTPLAARQAHGQDIIRQAKDRGVKVPDAYYAQKAKDPNAFEFRRAWKSSLRRAKQKRAAMRASGISTTTAAGAAAVQRATAVSGMTFKVPVLPIMFANTPARPYDYSILQNKLFGAGSATQETVTHVYDEMSRGALTLTGTVLPWIRVSGNDTQYEGTNNGLGSNLAPLLTETLDSADKTINFADYDSDGDGFVDFVAFVQPEYGAECGPTSTNKNIWSHRYYLDAYLGGPYLTKDFNAQGKQIKISDYVIQPAVNCPTGAGSPTPIDMGVFAHEFGHAFGLPDLYATNGKNEGIGEWGLMSSGNWNIPSSPSHMEAWSKMEMGWAPVVTVARDTSITLTPNESNGGTIIRIDIPGTSEYFLLENRQKVGSDIALHGTGLLIFHVDSNTVNSGWPTNAIQNTTAHKGLDLVEADGGAGMDIEGYRGGPGDIFPGSSGATSFTPTTAPNTNGYSITSGISITNIVQSGQNVSFNVSFAPPGTLTIRWGDLNGDGTISMADYKSAYNCLIGASCSTGLDLSRGDVDGDGRFTATDALIIHSYVLGTVDVSRFRVGQPVSGAPAPLASSAAKGSGVSLPEGPAKP